MHIIHIVRDIDKISGGPSRSISNLANYVGKADSNIVSSICFLDRGNSRIKIDNSVSQVALTQVTYRRDLYRYIESTSEANRPLVLHLHGIWDWLTLKAAAIATEKGIPFVWSPRGMLEPWSLSQKKLRKAVCLKLLLKKRLNQATTLHATAEMEANNLRALGLTSPVSIIPNGIPPIAITEREPKVDCGLRKALFLSRLHPKKGIEMLIDAWGDLRNRFPNWTCRIVGPGNPNYVQTLKDRIVENGLGGILTIEPQVSDAAKWDLYQESELFILPTFSENFGIVIAEALGSGIPVVTTNGTPWDFLPSENIGWYIKPTRQDLLGALSEALTKSPSELSKMGSRGRTIIEQDYFWDSLAHRYANLYSSISKRS